MCTSTSRSVSFSSYIPSFIINLMYWIWKGLNLNVWVHWVIWVLFISVSVSVEPYSIRSTTFNFYFSFINFTLFFCWLLSLFGVIDVPSLLYLLLSVVLLSVVLITSLLWNFFWRNFKSPYFCWKLGLKTWIVFKVSFYYYFMSEKVHLLLS